MKQVHNSTTLNRRLRASASLASLAVALASLAVPASADPTAIYFGGSTLASQTMRQLGDCHFDMGPIPSDGFMSSPSFTSSPPTPGLIPTNCLTSDVALLYAAVGSGNGFRGYISNLPDQWYGGTVDLNTTISPPPFPSVPPPYTNSNFPALTAYPYLRVDVALSDAPLPDPATDPTITAITTTIAPFIPTTNWTTTSTISVGSTAPVTTFSTGTMGNPIQLPAFEVGVAIGVNTTGLNINSKILDPATGNPVVGGAAQLTQAQMCAIFSGRVTTWDSAVTINYDAVATATAPFSYANVGNGMGAAPYASTSVPIRLVYRSDGSGTSFIITNYLKSVCPQLDPSGSFGYTAIFNQPNLPSTTFQNLVANVMAAGNSTANWVPANGSDGVATTISNGGSGFMGYVSDDFTNPYATQVSGVPGLPAGTTVATTVSAPLSASVQNEQQRIAGTTVPAMMTTTAPTFIPPAPAGIDKAWTHTTANPSLMAPSTTATYAGWNVYGQVFPDSTMNGTVDVSGKSILPLTTTAGAYPLAGTTFMAPYSCYSTSTDSTRTADILNFLNWLYQNPFGSQTPPVIPDLNVAAIIQNNGFHELNSDWQSALQQEYLTPTSANAISAFNTAGSQMGGCVGVTGGAN